MWGGQGDWRLVHLDILEKGPESGFLVESEGEVSGWLASGPQKVSCVITGNSEPPLLSNPCLQKLLRALLRLLSAHLVRCSDIRACPGQSLGGGPDDGADTET